MTKYSPSIEFEETEISIPTVAVEQGIITGAIINANSGYGKEVIDLYSVDDLLENFGIPTDINYKNWFNLRDYLVSKHQLKVVRAVPTNAKNSSMQLNGVSHLKLSTWYNSTNPKNLNKPTESLYNKDVADFNLFNDNSSFMTNSKMEIINRFVTTNQDLSIAVCSNADHYEQSIFNDEIEVIRNFNQSQAPTTPSEFEKYTILRLTQDIKTANDTTDILTVLGDYTILKTGDKIVISGSTANDGTYTLTADVTYDGTDSTITLDTDDLTDSTADGKIEYLKGDWSDSIFVTGDLVNYDGSVWGVVTKVTGYKYYVELLGKVYEWSGTAWVAKLDLKYLPVDANGDSKSEYAVKDIFDSSLLNSNNSVKTFKEIYKTNLDFVDEYNALDETELVKNNILIFVLKKNITSGKWMLMEQHLGSSVNTARDDNNNSFFIDKIVNDDSDYIYVKSGEINTYTVTSNTTSAILIENTDLENFQIGEKIKYTEDSVVKIATITDMAYATLHTTITIDKTLVENEVSIITDEVSGKVSTNYNKYGNPRDAEYDISNFNASDGFSVNELIIYDYSPTNSDGLTITDYADLSTTDLNTSAEVFLDEDNVNVNLLLPFETIDEFGNHHQDKMASIAKSRGLCYAIIVPFDETLFLGVTNEVITENLVTEFGNQRENLYSGTFTGFSKYAGVNICSMKYYEDTYNNKFRWLTYAGDIGRMIVEQDSSKGVWFPIAGTPDGTINNQIKTAFIPKEEYREELNKNGINTLYKNSSLTNPVLFSNLTSYRTDGLFQVLSYRLMLNKIENFVKNALFPQLFKFKTDNMKKRIKDLVNPFLKKIVNSGGLESGTLIFPEIANESSNTVNIMIKLVPNGVIEHFILKIEMTEANFTIEEV